MLDNFYSFQNAILEKYPHGAKTSDSGLTKDFQQARLALWQIRNFCLIFDRNTFDLKNNALLRILCYLLRFCNDLISLEFVWFTQYKWNVEKQFSETLYFNILNDIINKC